MYSMKGGCMKDCATTDDRVSSLPISGPITNLCWTQVYFLLRIEDTVCSLPLISKHALLAPSRLHYCDNACFPSFLSPDFT